MIGTTRDPLAPNKKRSHADLKRAVMRAVNRLPGTFVFPSGVGAFTIGARFVRMGMVGVSDLIGWREIAVPGTSLHLARFVALEIKIGTDRLSREQAAFLEKVRDAGGIALEIRSVEQAVRALT